MKFLVAGLLFATLSIHVNAHEVLETGAKMPDEWIDKDTHHKIVRLTRKEGSNYSFYFHNNPFVGNKMVFYNTAPQKQEEQAAKVEISNTSAARNRQIYMVDLKTLAIEQLTNHATAMNGEIVAAKTNEIFFQVKDSVFCVDIKTKKETLVYVFPEDFKASITVVNADGTLLGGAKSSDEEKELFKNIPASPATLILFTKQSYPALYLRLI